IDGKNQRTEFEYDGLGRNTVTRHPDNHEKTLEYNALVQTRRVDEVGRATVYGYDPRNRLLTVDYENNGNDRIYTYDGVGNILQVDEAGTLEDVAYTYDNLNRVVTETSVGITHLYTYDLAGNRIHARIGDGQGGVVKTLLSTYDALNRTSTILEDENENGLPDIGERLSGYQYDLAGGIRIKTQPNEHEIVKMLDAMNRAQIITGPDGTDNQPLYVYAHAFDLYGNLANINETYPSQNARLDARNLVNQYDPANRLITETVQTGNETVTTTYMYDNAHNRTGKTVELDDGNNVTSLEQAVYTYTNDLNQMSGFTDAVSGKVVTYAYDLNGNRTNRSEDSNGDTVINETAVYAYDADNRLLTHQKTAGGVSELYEYAYDYRTRRILRDETGAGGDRTLVVFSGGLSVQEWTAANPAQQPNPAVDSLEVLYIRGSDYGGGIGGVLYTLRDLNEDGDINNAAFNHYNSRGDVVARMDDGGALLYQAAYEAFGRHGDTPGSQEWGSTADRQQANTKDEDPTGLLNEGFRYRDLETGTFITRDPLGIVDGPNVYTYVVQNPWTAFDPNGLNEFVDWVDETVDTAVDHYEGNSNNTASQIGTAILVTGMRAFQGVITALPRGAEDTGGWGGESSVDPSVLISEKTPIVGPAGDRLGRASYDFSEDPSLDTGVELVGAVSQSGLAVAGGIQGKRVVQKKINSQKPADVSLESSAKCFAADTVVATPSGDVEIQDLKKGDIVYAYDFESTKVVERKVVDTIRNYTYSWLNVKVSGEVIEVTNAHLFWVESEKKWMHARDLKLGMKVLLGDESQG
ncbi:MAG: polymorphic toxin-type HINT domain-containing protein, partial [Kiritimatiellae bacterium]|nr:polymorphic toxin-type HINT domain-containing protein [Kiritimatiellia bacterium]